MSTAFDVTGPLPSGVTVLEASAGTGKTYTIAALAARYVAEGVPLERLLLVTFTRMATGELRDRVRERLVTAEQGLARALAGAPPHRDEVVRLLCVGAPEEVELRRRRLAHALADFDSATIATTHGFCQEVLGGLGVAGDVEPGVTFVEDPGDLVEQIADILDDLGLRLHVTRHADATQHLLAEPVGGGDRRRVEVRQRPGEPGAPERDLLPGRIRQQPHDIVGGRAQPQLALGADQPLAHAVAQLARGHPRERDQQQPVQRHALGHVARGQRRDRVRLAGPRAGLEHGDAGRKRAADVERPAHASPTTSTASRPRHRRSAYWPKRVGSTGSHCSSDRGAA